MTFDKINDHRQRVSRYKIYRKEINTQDIEMPFKIKDLNKLHSQNTSISVSILF